LVRQVLLLLKLLLLPLSHVYHHHQGYPQAAALVLALLLLLLVLLALQVLLQLKLLPWLQQGLGCYSQLQAPLSEAQTSPWHFHQPQAPLLLPFAPHQQP
jgi:hypothetical protein